MGTLLGIIGKKGATDILLDENKRKFIAFIVFSAVIFPIVMFAVLIEIISNPIENFIGNEDETSFARELKDKYYYDEETGTVNEGVAGVFMWPVPDRTMENISSPFGYRIHPIFGTKKLHTGIDIGGRGVYGLKILSAEAGTVTTAGYINGYGNSVIIDHGNNLTTLYGHNQELLVSVGQTVGKGELIAKMGSTGNSTGPHLHFEVRVNGEPSDPMPYLTQVKTSNDKITPEIQNAVRLASAKYNVKESLIYATIQTESNFNPNARSPVGAGGLMQLMPATASSLGCTNVFDIDQNINAGTKYLSQLLKRWDNDTKLALASYNAGTGNVEKYGGVPPFKETQNYVIKVMKLELEYASQTFITSNDNQAKKE